MTLDATFLTVRMGVDLKRRWAAHCATRGVPPTTAVKDLIEREIGQEPAAVRRSSTLRQTREDSGDQPKVRVEILLTASEKAAVEKQAQQEGCSQRRWIVDAIRAGLTGEPQASTKEVEVLGESNYQLLAVGRNLNQIAKRINQGKMAHVSEELLQSLRQQIGVHVDTVSRVLRASVERWRIE